MAIDASFWVAISFFIFIGALIYLKIPQKINEILNKLISDIKNELDESEKLRTEAKTLLDNAQSKLDTADTKSKDILAQAKKESENLIIELNDKFHKSAELKKNLAENNFVVTFLSQPKVGKFFLERASKSGRNFAQPPQTFSKLPKPSRAFSRLLKPFRAFSD